MYKITMALPALAAALSAASPARADAPAQLPAVQVTATRIATPLLETPASVSVISGDELRARGAADLRTALAGVAGVEISPGGDSGPAGSVPAFWGLREFDAFLLVVDDVPWGGAFNPALTTLDLHNVERIEVMRGAAPVMYGATSFVGVIHVIHYPAGQSAQRATVSAGGVAGNAGNAAAAAALALPALGDWQQSLSADIERQRYADEQAKLARGHVAYRLGSDLWGGHTRFDVDIKLLRQAPQSPYPRVSTGLDPTVDTDANFNPSDARLDENRFHLAGQHVRPTALGEWGTTLALTHTSNDIIRGFVAEACEGGTRPSDSGDNACGFIQDRKVSDLYFDTHLISTLSPGLRLVWGADALLGSGEQASDIFTYSVDPKKGGNAPGSGSRPVVSSNELEDERTFLGVYGQVEWQPVERVDLFAGLRLNRTQEKRDGEAEDDNGNDVPARDTRDETRLSGTLGISWRAWQRDGDTVTLFADYRDTFKPAAIDFGPEAEAEILKPETARSYEAGVKTRWLDNRLQFDVSGFYMNMQNLVVPQEVNGTPGLTNAGTLFFKGAEAELSYRVLDALRIFGAYARHDLRFGDYERLFGSTLTQLRGNYQELAPRNTGSAGLVYAPAHGLQAAASYAYTGHRYLNKRNTSKADAFDVIDAMLGYRFHGWDLKLVGSNLTDARDPVSESELGDGQYYRMPARTLELMVGIDL
ncbi:TonB-dependent receptor [Fontimonas sp. SYSU GA230001]|uniref:TonB-dependent receptor n=1 Tax=Fontimonas sp. SYSU GA230001 TaxID=3142450 RepID=UPI0032B5A22D